MTEATWTPLSKRYVMWSQRSARLLTPCHYYNFIPMAIWWVYLARPHYRYHNPGGPGQANIASRRRRRCCRPARWGHKHSPSTGTTGCPWRRSLLASWIRLLGGHRAGLGGVRLTVGVSICWWCRHSRTAELAFHGFSFLVRRNDLTFFAHWAYAF